MRSFVNRHKSLSYLLKKLLLVLLLSTYRNDVRSSKNFYDDYKFVEFFFLPRMYLMCDDEGNDRPTNITQMNDVYYQIPPTPCAGCQLSITDRYYLLVAERCWHVDCLQCCVCGTKLESEVTCFSRAGLIFCKDDYYK